MLGPVQLSGGMGMEENGHAGMLQGPGHPHPTASCGGHSRNTARQEERGRCGWPSFTADLCV